jgi:hypothetical protein
VSVLVASAIAAAACGKSKDGEPSDDGGAGSSGSSATGGGAARGGSGSGGGAGRGGGSGAGAPGGGSGGTASGSGGASQAGAAGAAVGGGGTAGGSGAAAGQGGGSGSGDGKGRAADLAKQLGRQPNFFIGMGNDLSNDHDEDGAYTLGVTLDLHYAYLVGLPGEGGWPDWNADGSFVNILTDTADAHGVTPMFTLYAMAAHGEGNPAALTDGDYMGKYWAQAKLLFERLAIFDKPSVVHLEPDFWAFFQQQSGGDPASVPVLIHGLAVDCDDQPEDLAGLGHCLIKLSRRYSPKTAIGFHASTWAGEPGDTVTFLNALGAGDSDFVAIDLLDRDAGCFEAGVDEACMRGGDFYWDESNQTSPNFHEFLTYSKTISDGLAKPVIWWQVPFGVPSDTPGGTAGHYRDNRVHYIFSHIAEFVAAGGLGCAFGVGAGNQTYIDTDGGQFEARVKAYFAAPTPLP